jgi:hypothetical protein
MPPIDIMQHCRPAAKIAVLSNIHDVNQAMKYGTPVVGTPLAVKGMFASDGSDCMVGTTAKDFACKVSCPSRGPCKRAMLCAMLQCSCHHACCVLLTLMLTAQHPLTSSHPCR